MTNQGGMTLMEVMTAVVIVGILAAIALPSFSKTVDVGRCRSARDILLTIYAGEQVNWARDDRYLTLGAGGDWSPIFMDDPNRVSGPVQFSVSDNGLSGAAASFTATATYKGQSMTITPNPQTITMPAAWTCR